MPVEEELVSVHFGNGFQLFASDLVWVKDENLPGIVFRHSKFIQDILLEKEKV